MLRRDDTAIGVCRPSARDRHRFHARSPRTDRGATRHARGESRNESGAGPLRLMVQLDFPAFARNPERSGRMCGRRAFGYEKTAGRRGLATLNATDVNHGRCDDGRSSIVPPGEDAESSLRCAME